MKTDATAPMVDTDAIEAEQQRVDRERLAAEEALQGERYLQLSQRCHEQNWAVVHALAEQIALHKLPPQQHQKQQPTPGGDKADNSAAKDDGDADDNIPLSASRKRAAREGSVSISGEIIHHIQQEILDDDGDVMSTDEVVDINDKGEEADGEGGAKSDSNNAADKEATTPPSKPPPPPATYHNPSTPRFLSTCLGTASPLAWTCRYSAPSSTVKLVLDLDASAVRRCLPQLGTPLHECVGRPRPLRTTPSTRGNRWSNLIAAGNDSIKHKPQQRGGGGKSPSSPSKKKKKKHNKKKRTLTPRILSGLREWRRTVRTLINADELLMKEDAQYYAALLQQQQAAAAASNGGMDEEKNTEEWRRTVQSMIKDNVTNIERFKRLSSDSIQPGDMQEDDKNPSSEAERPSPNSSSSKSLPTTQERHHCSTRATLSQDADGNTPLHFMIRGAAAPVFGGGRWQSRRELEEDLYDTDEDDDEDDEEGGAATMDVDGSNITDNSSAGEGTGGASTDLRRIEYTGNSGSSWDGVRWCMEAHLRRVERRLDRSQKMRWTKSDVRMNSSAMSSSDGDVESQSDGGVSIGRRALASVHIASPMKKMNNSEEGEKEEEEVDGKPRAIEPPPAKKRRSSLEFSPSDAPLRKQSSSSLGSFSHLLPLKEQAKNSSGSSKHNRKQRRRRRRKNKYLNDDECQDCRYDPLLGAVRDLVHSCPEAVGIPDYREYEETPLIVALKSSIYVVMEPEADFQLAEQLPAAAAGPPIAIPGLPPPPGGGAAAAAAGGGGGGDGFAIPGMQQQFNDGGGMGAAGGFAGGMLGFGGFPFPELGALMHNRTFNIFPDDEAMMAVLRGHGRRVTRDVARRNNRLSSSPAAAAASSTSFQTTTTQDDSLQESGKDKDDDSASSCSSVSDDSSFDGDDDDDPRHDAFIPTSTVAASNNNNEQQMQSAPNQGGGGLQPTRFPAQPFELGALFPRRRLPRYDYQTALEYRIFCLVQIMLDAYPRAACLMISDYTPLHSAVFHGRCADTIRLLLDAEARFRRSDDVAGGGAIVPNDGDRERSGSSANNNTQASLPPGVAPCPTLSGPAMLCTNTRGELPLHFACMRNECGRTVRLLASADPRSALVRDASGRTPLRWLWIRFVDGLLDRFGGRDTRRDDAGDDENGDDGMDAADDQQRQRDADRLSFRGEQEGERETRNFPNPGRSVLGGGYGVSGHGSTRADLLVYDAFDNCSADNAFGMPSSLDDNESMFVFDTEYLRQTRTIDRTVDFLRMRHVPSGFENIEYVAAEHAITVLLKLKYLQQRRNRQLEAYDTAARATSSSARGNNDRLSPPLPAADVTMSTKEEFILYAFEKFTALIYAAHVASDVEERTASGGAVDNNAARVEEAKPSSTSQTTNNEEMGNGDDDTTSRVEDIPSRKKLWRSLVPPRPSSNHSKSNKKFFLVHEACGSSRASCPAAVAKICIKLFSDQLYQRDDDGRLPLHRVACRGLGWEPPATSEVDPSSGHVSLADETLTLLKGVLNDSHERASEMYDAHRQLPLHCAVDSLVTSVVMGKRRRASLHAEARVALQRYRRSHVEIAMQCLSELLHANSTALQRRDGRTCLFPFMQAALPHVEDCAVVKYTSDLSRRPGFDVGSGFHSMENEVVEEDDMEAESDHLTIIFYLLREDPSVINGLG